MNFIIVDFDHYEMIHSLVRCIEDYSDEIYVCSNEESIKQLQKNSYSNDVLFKWIVASDGNELSMQSQLFGNIFFDYVLLNTVYSHFDNVVDWLKGLNYNKSVLTIHNVNYWFKMGTRFKLFSRPRSKSHAQMLSLIDNVDALLMLSDNIKEYALKAYNVKKRIIVFPYSVNENIKVTHSENDKTTIVIPGIIEKGRKDYDMVIDAFCSLDKLKYKLVLLGKPKSTYGLEIIEKCKKIENEGFDVKYFDDYVKQEDFEVFMNMSDVVLAPISINTSYGGIEEKYGQSKETGAVFDIIRYVKPGIIPKELTTSKDIESACLLYTGKEELSNALKKINDKNVIRQLRFNALRVSENYYYKNVARRFIESLKSIM